MALGGVQRATMDLDFILMLDDLETAHRLLLAAAREQRVTLDRELLEDYLRLFNLEDKLPHLQSVHGSTN